MWNRSSSQGERGTMQSMEIDIVQKKEHQTNIN
jgi:hypothetical protein